MSEIEIKVLGDADSRILHNVADGVFDRAIRPALAAEFLRDSRHHLVVAIRDEQVIGFASAVHYVHPDKPPELWINEIGVHAADRRRGIGKQLMKALFGVGRDLGCREAWVLADAANSGAQRFYRELEGGESNSVMFAFSLPSDADFQREDL